MRWLLRKDLTIMRRSPALIATVVLYPILVALLIGLAVSSPPAKPVVAVYNGVPAGQQTVLLGTERFSIAKYEKELYGAITPLAAGSPAQAIADVRAGRALAALIIPADIDQQVQQLIAIGTGNPTVQIVYNSANPVQRALVKNALQSRVDAVQTAIAGQLTKAVLSDFQKLVGGGSVSLLGGSIKLLGLKASRTLLQAQIAKLPRGSALAAALTRVVNFATIAIDGITIASPEINSVTQPLNVQESALNGHSTPSATYAAAIAAAVLVMFVAVLLGAGMLALERSENAFSRLVPRLVAPRELLTEKLVLAAGCAFVMTLATSAVLSAVAPIELSRLPLWLAAIALAAVAFSALGLAVGAIARDLSVASLLAVLIALPVAFIALVPSSVVSSGVSGLLAVISFVFPFRATLDALTGAFDSGGPGLPLPLLHLAVLAAVFFAVGRWAIGREAGPAA